MSKEQKYRTYCNIPVDGHPCGQEIVIAPAMNVPTLGMESDDKAKALVRAVVAHLVKKHPPLGAATMALWEQYLGYIALGFTQSEDANIAEYMAKYAAHLCQIATVPVTDNMIVEMVTRMGYTMEGPQREKIIAGIKYVRDFSTRKITPQSVMAG